MNGVKASAWDFNHRIVEIGPLVRPGENIVTFEVSSTLNNRLRARHYHDIIAKMLAGMTAEFPNQEPDDDVPPPLSTLLNRPINPPVQDYGLESPVSITFDIDARFDSVG